MMSSNHHYIPRYYIKGFKTDTDNELFVYYKESDTLDQKKKKGPKGLFFTPDLNTVLLPDGEKSSLLEDVLFKKIDDCLSKTILKLRDITSTDQFHDIKIHGNIDIIITDLFWRNPSADGIFEQYFNNPEQLSAILASLPPEIGLFYQASKEDEGWEKMIRACMGFWTNECHSAYIKDNPSINKYYLRTSDTDIFVIGDCPIVFNISPKNVEQLYQSSYFFPISSKKLYLKNADPHSDFTRYAIWLNALIIDQSKKFICSNDFGLLERSVEKYRELKKYGTLQSIKNTIFT